MIVFEGVLIAVFAASYFCSLTIFHFIVFAVNRRLPQNDPGIPHSLYWGGWSKLQTEYDKFFPNGRLYKLTVNLAWIALTSAIVFAILQVLGYASGGSN